MVLTCVTSRLQGGDLQQQDQIFYAEGRPATNRSRSRCWRANWTRQRCRNDRGWTECLRRQSRGWRRHLVTPPFPRNFSESVQHDTLSETGPSKLYARQPALPTKPALRCLIGFSFAYTRSFFMISHFLTFLYIFAFSIHHCCANLHSETRPRTLHTTTSSVVVYLYRPLVQAARFVHQPLWPQYVTEISFALGT